MGRFGSWTKVTSGASTANISRAGQGEILGSVRVHTDRVLVTKSK